MAAVAHIARYLTYLVRSRSRYRNDASTADSSNWDASPTSLPPTVEMRWLGTSGFSLSCEGTTIIIDPYITRFSVGSLLRRRVVAPARDLVDTHIPRADAVLIGHSHFDHVLDAPYLAQRDRAKVYGSRSCANLMKLYDLPELAVEVEPYRTYDIGPFEVTFVPSVHSKLVLGWRVPMSGELSCEHLDGLVPSAYKCGQVWGIHIKVAGTSFYHQGSADLIEDAMRHKRIDFFLAGIAGRGFTKNYVPRILRVLEPRAIIAHHFDNFFKPITGPTSFSTNVNVSGFFNEVRSVSADFEVLTLRPLQSTTPVQADAAHSKEQTDGQTLLADEI